MKVILLKDIKGTGKVGQVLDVSDGHGKNYLIPRGLAKEATEGNIKILEAQKKSIDKKKAQELDNAQDLAKKLEGVTIIIKTKVGEGGKLFGSITTKEISEKIKDLHGLDIDKKKMNLKTTIKGEGTFSVEIRLHPEVKAVVNLVVEGI
jgi:large subunit ribosomal protein L9